MSANYLVGVAGFADASANQAQHAEPLCSFLVTGKLAPPGVKRPPTKKATESSHREPRHRGSPCFRQRVIPLSCLSQGKFAAEKRGQLIRHLEEALELADEIEGGETGFLIERALDQARARQFRPIGGAGRTAARKTKAPLGGGGE